MTGTEATDTLDTTAQRPQWSLATLIAFRFDTCYFGSFGLALVIGLIPVILAGIGIDGPWSAMRGLIHVMRPPIVWTGTDPSSFPLVERGFNWVQELPYNR